MAHVSNAGDRRGSAKPEKNSCIPAEISHILNAAVIRHSHRDEGEDIYLASIMCYMVSRLDTKKKCHQWILMVLQPSAAEASIAQTTCNGDSWTNSMKITLC